MRTGILFTTLLLIIAGSLPQASFASTRIEFNSDKLSIRLIARTPEQVAAFYEARGFLKPMVDKISQYCFIGISIHNKSKEILWHNLKDWRFTSAGKNINRLDRTRIKHMWDHMKIPLSHQSTFRWTLLPEQLDFRPNEGEGGNVLLPWPDKPVAISATFTTGKNRQGKLITVNFEKISCKK